jgi:hypothetical protein
LISPPAQSQSARDTAAIDQRRQARAERRSARVHLQRDREPLLNAARATEARNVAPISPCAASAAHR